MKITESLVEYSRLAGHEWPVFNQITAYRLAPATSRAATFAHIRRDFYKLKLLRQADGVLRYGDQQVAVQGDALLFVNPQLPHSWQSVGDPYAGYVCLFARQFVTPHLKTARVAHSPLFSVGAVPVLPLPAAVADHLSQLFEGLLHTLASDYAGRYEVASSYLSL